MGYLIIAGSVVVGSIIGALVERNRLGGPISMFVFGLFFGLIGVLLAVSLVLFGVL